MNNLDYFRACSKFEIQVGNSKYKFDNTTVIEGQLKEGVN